MLDFLFITSPSYASNPHPPYYFMYLASYLRKRGLKVKILDVKGKDTPKYIEYHLQDIRSFVFNTQPRFIGLSAFHNDYPMMMRLGKMVKEVQPQITLLVGNAHATINPEDFIYKNSPFDIAVLGEGEETCWELWKFKERTKGFESMRLEEIKGIAYLGLFKNVVKSCPRPFIKSKDIPMPVYDLVDMDWYLKPQKLIIRRIYASMIPVYGGRGCAWNCSFCAANSIWKANTGKVARLRPVKDVIEEIQYLQRNYDIDFFYMFDDTFGIDKNWMKQWFKEKRKIDFSYACQTRANLIDEDMVKGLKETGCIQVDIGVETGSQWLLDHIQKHITLEQVRNAVRLLQKYHIRYFFTMLLNLPAENLEDLKKTYNFLEDLKPNGVIFGITTPYPGTKIYNDYCYPRLTKEEYHLLTNNRLNPIERFRMAEHKINLEELWEKWNLKFRATPMFERMWCLFPFQGLYWKTILRSHRKKQYLKAWSKDLAKTFILYWLHVLGIYKLSKRIQYGRD